MQRTNKYEYDSNVVAFLLFIVHSQVIGLTEDINNLHFSSQAAQKFGWW